MRSLKRQVNAAIRYRELSEQLRELEIRAAWLEFVRLTSEIEILKHQFSESTDRYEKVSARICDAGSAPRRTGGAIASKWSAFVMARQQGVYEIESEMEKIERQIALHPPADRILQEDRGRARDREELLQRAATLDAQTAQTGSQRRRDRAREIELSGNEINLKVEAHAQAATEVAETEARLEAMRARHTERVTDRARTQTALETLSETIEGVDGQLAVIYERIRSSRPRATKNCLQCSKRRGGSGVREAAGLGLARTRPRASRCVARARNGYAARRG